MFSISPSLLSADFARLGEQIEVVESTGEADRLHIDVMDGHFVPNITIGPLIVEAVRPRTKLTLEAHLMIEAPGRYVGSFVEAGADIVVVHVEACPHLHRDIQYIKQLGARPGVALNPATPLESVLEVIEEVHQVLVMTVNPGFGGQKFISSVLPKIERVRRIVDQRGLNVEVAVDGGVNAEVVRKVVDAGAKVVVAGSFVFAHKNGIVEAIRELRDNGGG
ncbi:MAG: ribulose-phosphate 3-epimerase [Chloroflexi bacterium]|nr:ribulose-phosphate 3-epimerase [Chloroflexota bacterium]